LAGIAPLRYSLIKEPFMSPASRRLFFLLATLFVASSSLAQTFAPGGSWTVRDANNKVVGQALTDRLVSTVINGYPVGLYVSRNGIEPTWRLSFAQTNCQGDAFIAISDFTVNDLDTPAGMMPNGTLRIAPYAQQTVSMTRHSMSASGVCINDNTTADITALPTQAGPNIKVLFAAPFSAVSVASAPMLSPMVMVALIAAIVMVAVGRLRVG
jgi:hypothetical protein